MRRARAGLTLLLALTGGMACRSNGERPDVPSGPQMTPVATREVELAPGQSTRVNGLTLKFEGVSADSRCPIGVQCFWEGDAVVVVSVSEPSRKGAALELHTAGRFPREGTYGRYRVRLVSLVPQPRAGEPVAADRYRATLQVAAE
jgi:hypothetical protein